MSIFSKWFSNKEPESSTSDEPKKPQLSASDYCEQGQKSLNAGKYVEAMEYFQAAIEAEKHFEKAYLLLASAYEMQGKKDKAKSTLYALLAIDPNNVEALKKIQGEIIDNNTNTVASSFNNTTTNTHNPLIATTPNASTQDNTPLSSNNYDVSIDYERNRLFFKIYGDEAHVVAPNISRANLVFSGWEGYKEPHGKVQIPLEVLYKGIRYRVSKIGEFAFAHCEWIISVEIPNSVVVIGKHAFANCNKLKSVTIPSSVVSIGEYAFSRCCLTSIIIPSTVKCIEHEAFSHNPLTRFVFPDGIQVADASVVYSCKEIRSITIPTSVKSIKGHWGDGISYSFMIRMMGHPPISHESIKRGLNVEISSEFYDEYDNAIDWQACNLRKRKLSTIIRKSKRKQVSWSVGIWGIVGILVLMSTVSALLMVVWERYFLGGLVVLIGASILTKITTGKWID
ncbi:MAG: leucine-rich repeat protein [Alphaproteobacteria bacterium]|nr:leucine-rich repeat protein [Alphaproteobacteria bacterium]